MKRYFIYLVAVCFTFGFMGFVGSVGANEPVSSQERIDAGKGLFTEKGCSLCHSILGEGGKTAPELDKWSSIASPTLWGAIMWNHVPDMVKAFSEKKMQLPEFKGEEVAYIFEYLHAQSGQGGGTYAIPGDKDRGNFLFQYLGCKQCHSARGSGGDIGPDLGAMAGKVADDNELAGRMLSHAPYMSKTAEIHGLYWPHLQGNEIAHLFAFFKSLER